MSSFPAANATVPSASTNPSWKDMFHLAAMRSRIGCTISGMSAARGGENEEGRRQVRRNIMTDSGLTEGPTAHCLKLIEYKSTHYVLHN